MRQTLKAIGILGLALSILLTATQPSKLPTVALVVPFVLLFSLLLLILIFIIIWQKGIVSGKSVRNSCLIAALPVILLVLQSLGQLTLRDAAMFVALFVIVYFYLSKTSSEATG